MGGGGGEMGEGVYPEKRERELGDKGAGSRRAGYRKREFLALLCPLQWPDYTSNFPQISYLGS